MSWIGYKKARRQVREAMTGAEDDRSMREFESFEIHNLVLLAEEDSALLSVVGETWEAIARHLQRIVAGGFTGSAPKGLVRAYSRFFTRAGLMSEKEAYRQAETLLGRLVQRQLEHIGGHLPADESPAALAAGAAVMAGANLFELTFETPEGGGDDA